MEPEKVLTEIKEKLKDKKTLAKEDFYDIVQGYFIKYMGYENNAQVMYESKNEKIYECVIDKKVMICGYKNETRVTSSSKLM